MILDNSKVKANRRSNSEVKNVHIYLKLNCIFPSRPKNKVRIKDGRKFIVKEKIFFRSENRSLKMMKLIITTTIIQKSKLILSYLT